MVAAQTKWHQLYGEIVAPVYARNPFQEYSIYSCGRRTVLGGPCFSGLTVCVGRANSLTFVKVAAFCGSLSEAVPLNANTVGCVTEINWKISLVWRQEIVGRATLLCQYSIALNWGTVTTGSWPQMKTPGSSFDHYSTCIGKRNFYRISKERELWKLIMYSNITHKANM